LFYFSDASAVRYKNWKTYCTKGQPDLTAHAATALHFTLVHNIDFGEAVGIDVKTAINIGGVLGGD
jgi:hypothetical protein